MQGQSDAIRIALVNVIILSLFKIAGPVQHVVLVESVSCTMYGECKPVIRTLARGTEYGVWRMYLRLSKPVLQEYHLADVTWTSLVTSYALYHASSPPWVYLATRLLIPTLKVLNAISAAFWERLYTVVSYT